MLFPKQKLLLVPTSVYNTPATAHFCQFQDSAPSPQAMQSLRRAAIWAAICVAATWAVTMLPMLTIAAHVTTRWPGCCGKVESVYPFSEHPFPFPCPRSTEAALLFLKKARQLDSVADFVGITVGDFFGKWFPSQLHRQLDSVGPFLDITVGEWFVDFFCYIFGKWESGWETRGRLVGDFVGDFVRSGLRRICDLVEIAYASRIPPLVAPVRDGNDAQKACAAGALGALAWNHDNLYPIAEAGGIPPLLALVRDGSAGQKEAATDALGNLAAIGYRGGYLSAIGIPMLVALVRSGNAEQKYNAADALRYFAMDNPIPIAEAGGIPPLVALVRDGNAEQKESAAGTLRNLALNDGNKIAIEKVIANGGDKIAFDIWPAEFSKGVWVELPVKLPVRDAMASSELPGCYGARNVLNGRMGLNNGADWATGWPSSTGCEGEWIQLDLGKPMAVSLLKFAGRVSQDQFRQVQLSFSDGSKRELELADDCLLNEYRLQQPITTSWVRITVLSCWIDARVSALNGIRYSIYAKRGGGPPGAQAVELWGYLVEPYGKRGYRNARSGGGGGAGFWGWRWLRRRMAIPLHRLSQSRCIASANPRCGRGRDYGCLGEPGVMEYLSSPSRRKAEARRRASEPGFVISL